MESPAANATPVPPDPDLDRPPFERHFTVSGFLSHEGCTALHWHRLGKWLPPGGHVESNEDPVQAVLREVAEETRIPARVIATAPAFPHASPAQLPPPVTVGVYDIPRDRGTPAPHQHIDLVYFTRPASIGSAVRLPTGEPPWLWASEAALRSGAPLTAGGREAPIDEDVRVLGLAAIEWERRDRATGSASARRTGAA